MVVPLIEELKICFPPIRRIAPYGECLAIPVKQFKAEWENILEAQGYRCHVSNVESSQVFIISLTAKAIPKKRQLVPWKEVDVKRFAKLWNQNPAYNAMKKEFPDRTVIALRQKATELKKAGIIDNSYVVKAKLKKKEPLKPILEIQVNPIGNPSFQDPAYQWSQKERDKVIELWNQNQTIPAIHIGILKLNPNRSQKAVIAELQRLRERHIIKSRAPWKTNAYRFKLDILRQATKETLANLTDPNMTIGEFCEKLKVSIKNKLRRNP